MGLSLVPLLLRMKRNRKVSPAPQTGTVQQKVVRLQITHQPPTPKCSTPKPTSQKSTGQMVRSSRHAADHLFKQQQYMLEEFRRRAKGAEDMNKRFRQHQATYGEWIDGHGCRLNPKQKKQEVAASDAMCVIM